MGRIKQGLAFAAAGLLAIATVLVLRHSPATAPVSVAWPVRSPAQRTLVLGPGSGFSVEEYSTETNRQQLTVRDDESAAQIWAYDPGTFDAASLVRGRRVRFGGHAGWFASDPAPTLFWRSTLGNW